MKLIIIEDNKDKQKAYIGALLEVLPPEWCAECWTRAVNIEPLRKQLCDLGHADLHGSRLSVYSYGENPLDLAKKVEDLKEETSGVLIMLDVYLPGQPLIQDEKTFTKPSSLDAERLNQAYHDLLKKKNSMIVLCTTDTLGEDIINEFEPEDARGFQLGIGLNLGEHFTEDQKYRKAQETIRDALSKWEQRVDRYALFVKDLFALPEHPLAEQASSVFLRTFPEIEAKGREDLADLLRRLHADSVIASLRKGRPSDARALCVLAVAALLSEFPREKRSLFECARDLDDFQSEEDFQRLPKVVPAHTLTERKKYVLLFGETCFRLFRRDKSRRAEEQTELALTRAVLSRNSFTVGLDFAPKQLGKYLGKGMRQLLATWASGSLNETVRTLSNNDAEPKQDIEHHEVTDLLLSCSLLAQCVAIDPNPGNSYLGSGPVRVQEVAGEDGETKGTEVLFCAHAPE